MHNMRDCRGYGGREIVGGMVCEILSREIVECIINTAGKKASTGVKNSWSYAAESWGIRRERI